MTPVTVAHKHCLASLAGNGATLIFGANQGNLRAIQGSDSTDIVLKNFTVDYDPLPFTQGRVIAVSAERRELTIELDAGCPDLFCKTGLDLQIYDPRSRLLKDNGGGLFNGNVIGEPASRTYTLRFGRPVDFIAAGDLAAIDGKPDKNKKTAPHPINMSPLWRDSKIQSNPLPITPPILIF